MTPRPDVNSAMDSSSSSSSNSTTSTIYLIRHGDRFDYANPEWLEDAKRQGNLLTDPPLSALGHLQARETAQALKQCIEKADCILSSPYLRVIQTAVPTSETLGVPISIEQGLSEAHATPGDVLPTPSQRFAYFPHIHLDYTKSLVEIEPTPGYTCPKTGHPCEAFAGKYCQRIEKLAQKLQETYRGQTVLCFSHAASVALVAALLKCPLEGLKLAPCGIYQLVRHNADDDGPWQMVRNGGSNEAYVSQNSPTTFPWGYGTKHFMEKKEDNGKYQGESDGVGLHYFCNATDTTTTIDK